MYHQLALSISTFFLYCSLFTFVSIFSFVSFLLSLSENSSELMLFVDFNRHEIKFLVSCISYLVAIKKDRRLISPKRNTRSRFQARQKKDVILPKDSPGLEHVTNRHKGAGHTLRHQGKGIIHVGSGMEIAFNL